MLKKLPMNRTRLNIILFFCTILTFILPATAWAAVEDTGFSDVKADAWYADAVVYCRENGLMNGNSATEFDPEDSLTRAMLVTVLYRLEGEPVVDGDDGFSDTTDGQWYSDAVLWAMQQSIVNGYGEGLFGPNDAITQEQLNLIMSRYTEEAVTQDIPTFTGDANPATRAQVAAVMLNLSTFFPGTSADEENDNQGSEPKILVAYFSATNNTENVARHIAATLNADLYEITPETPYTSADLNYNNANSRTSIEMNDPDSRPAIGSDSVANMADYDTVFIGYPIWWGQAPRIISTFMETYDFNGKTIVPFCTSGSSSIGSSATGLHSLADGAVWLDGRCFSGSTSQSEVAAWVNGLNLTAAGK